MSAAGRVAGVVTLALISVGVGASAVPDFARLEHTTRPLVQQGSANLLPNADFAEDLTGWRPGGDATIVEIDGARVLRLGPIAGEDVANVQVYVPEPKGGVLYRLRFEVLIPTDAELTWGSHSGLYGWFAASGPTKGSAGALRINEYRRIGEWMQREEFLFTHADTTALYVSLAWHADAGAALVRNVEVVEAPVSADEGRVILETPVGDFAEVRDVVTSGATPEEPTVWGADADTLRPYCVPPADAGSALQLAGTPGEMVIGALGLYAPEALGAITVDAEPLAGEPGALRVAPEVQQMVFMPRRTNYYGRGMTFYYVPDFLLDADSFDAPAGQTTGLWVSLRVPSDAAPGEYAGRITLHAGDFERSIPVTLRVYPFTLADTPDQVRHLYLDGGRWNAMSEPLVLDEIADVRDHGYESVPLSAGGEMVVEDGRITGYRLSDSSRRMIRLALEGGLRGPFGFWTGQFPARVRAALGLPEEALDGFADTWPEEITHGAVAAQRELRRAVEALGVEDAFIIAIDEPGYWKQGSPERYAWDMQVARESGWDTYCTTSTASPDPLGLHVTYHCYGGGHMFLDREHAAQIARLTRAQGQQLWYYCTGAYSGQIGRLLPNRYLAGFMFFRCGADGTASWTFQRPRGNPFDDFQLDDQGRARRAQPCITYPDPRTPGANLDTPQWEALRQAWYDHRYARTLQLAIETARHDGREAAANAAEARLDELMDGLPWNGDPLMYPELTNARLDEVRATLAEEIIRLQAL